MPVKPLGLKDANPVLFNYDKTQGRKDDVAAMHNKECAWLYWKSTNEHQKEMRKKSREDYIAANIEKINAQENDRFFDIEMSE